MMIKPPLTSRSFPRPRPTSRKGPPRKKNKLLHGDRLDRRCKSGRDSVAILHTVYTVYSTQYSVRHFYFLKQTDNNYHVYILSYVFWYGILHSAEKGSTISIWSGAHPFPSCHYQKSQVTGPYTIYRRIHGKTKKIVERLMTLPSCVRTYILLVIWLSFFIIVSLDLPRIFRVKPLVL